MGTGTRVAVAGATGYLGGYVVRALASAGYRVRALARDESRLGAAREACDEVFVAQATRPESLTGFCDDCEIVYAGLGIRSGKRKPTVWDVDYRANLNVLEGARASGARHFVFVSAIGGDRLRTRGVAPAEARERVIDAAKQSGLRWTVIRGTGYFNDMAEIFNMARKGRGWMLGNGQNRMNPIHGADLAVEVVKAIQSEGTDSNEITRGGPDVFTLDGILELAFRALGKPPRITHVPRWLLPPARLLTRPFNQTVSGFIHAIHQITAFPDLTAPACGTHRLEDFYRELAAAAK